MSSKYAAKAPEQATSRSEFAKAFKNRRQNRNSFRDLDSPLTAKFMTFSATPEPSESSPDRLRPGKTVASSWIFHQKC